MRTCFSSHHHCSLPYCKILGCQAKWQNTDAKQMNNCHY